MIEFKVIIVEDVPLELKGTEGILKSDVPEAKIVGTAENEVEYWRIMKDNVPEDVKIDRLNRMIALQNELVVLQQ